MFSITIPVPSVIVAVFAVVAIVMIVKWVASWITG